MQSLIWQIKSFDNLTTRELFEIYKARTNIFVVEQNCPYPEVDDWDLTASHVFAKNNEKMTAYCRIIPKETGIHIGRVLVVAEYRGQGLAQHLMETALTQCREQWPNSPIFVQAQAYLKDFYQGLGFEAVSEVYLEDGIAHLDMVKS